MAKSGVKDPGHSIREAIATLEERVDTIAGALMGTEEFARTANIANTMQLRVQKGVNDHMSRQLAMFNMPSREDINALGERVMVMDDRLVRIEEMLRRLTPVDAATVQRAKPPRTKKPRTKKAPSDQVPAKQTKTKKTAAKKKATTSAG